MKHDLTTALTMPIALTALGIIGLPTLGWEYVAKRNYANSEHQMGLIIGVLAIVLGSVGACVFGLPISMLIPIPMFITLPVCYYLTLFGLYYMLTKGTVNHG